MDLVDALKFCGGAARWERLRELGVSGHEMTAARGELWVAHGTYALTDAPPAIVAAVRLRGVASHTSAAGLLGFALWRTAPGLHVTVGSGRGRAPGVQVHRATLLPADVDEDRPITSPLRTVLDCGRTLPLAPAVAVMESALLARAVDLSTLRSAAETVRGPGSVALRQAIEFIDEGAESALESPLRMLVVPLGRKLQTQVHVPGVGRVDVVLDSWLALEGDGYEYHSDRATYREDRRRGNALVVGRFVVLRFSWEDVYLRPAYVLATVERVLAAGPPWGSQWTR
jgi:very-short-patch-repair endonuclease